MWSAVHTGGVSTNVTRCRSWSWTLAIGRVRERNGHQLPVVPGAERPHLGGDEPQGPVVEPGALGQTGGTTGPHHHGGFVVADGHPARRGSGRAGPDE